MRFSKYFSLFDYTMIQLTLSVTLDATKENYLVFKVVQNIFKNV